MSKTKSLQHFRIRNQKEINRIDQNTAAEKRSKTQEHDQTKTRLLRHQVGSHQAQHPLPPQLQTHHRRGEIQRRAQRLLQRFDLLVIHLEPLRWGHAAHHSPDRYRLFRHPQPQRKRNGLNRHRLWLLILRKRLKCPDNWIYAKKHNIQGSAWTFRGRQA